MKHLSTVAMIALLAGSVSLRSGRRTAAAVLNFARYDGSTLIDPIYADKQPGHLDGPEACSTPC
jgi:hypothetical protein